MPIKIKYFFEMIRKRWLAVFYAWATAEIGFYIYLWLEGSREKDRLPLLGYLGLFLFLFLFISCLTFILVLLLRRGRIKIRLSWHMLFIWLVFFAALVADIDIFFKRRLEINDIYRALAFLKYTAIILGQTMFFFLASFGVGKKIFNHIVCDDSTPFPETILFSLGLGMGFVMYVVYAISFWGVAYQAVMSVVLFFLAILGWKEIRELLVFVNKYEKTIILEKKHLGVSIAVCCLGFLLSSVLLYSMAGLLSGSWDTFHQYLTFPETYAKNHGLVYFPYHPHWGFPQGAEMIFLAGILLGGTIIPFMMNFFFMIFTVLALKQILIKFGNKFWVWMLAIVLSIPLLLIFQAGYLKVELIFSFYLALAYLALYHILEKENKTRWLAILAIISGVMVGIKYTAFFVLAGFLISFFTLRKKNNFSFAQLALFSFIVFVLFIPWGAKNWAYYNNPIYPMVDVGKNYWKEKLGANCQSAFIKNCRDDMFLMNNSARLKSGSTVASNVLVGLKDFFKNGNFSITDAGPWFVIFLPLVFVSWLKTEKVYIKFISTFSFIYFVFWLVFLSGQTWYLAPALLGFLIVTANFLEDNVSDRQFRPFQVLITSWLIIVLLIMLAGENFIEKVRYARGEVGLEESLKNIRKSQKKNYRVDWLRTWNYVSDDLLNKDQHGLVYGFLDTQGYFIKDSYKNFIPDFFGYLFSCMEQKGDVFGQMKKINVQYIISNRSFSKSCKKAKKLEVCRVDESFQAFITEHGREIHHERDIVVYELR